MEYVLACIVLACIIGLIYLFWLTDRNNKVYKLQMNLCDAIYNHNMKLLSIDSYQSGSFDEINKNFDANVVSYDCYTNYGGMLYSTKKLNELSNWIGKSEYVKIKPYLPKYLTYNGQ